MDGHFQGYNNLNAATAATLLQHLNDPTYGATIELIYVTYQQSPGNAIYDAIQGVTLNDGRAATDVITPAGGHRGHFHCMFRP